MYAIGSNSAKRSRDEPTGLLSGGKHSARKLKRAQILLAADTGAGGEAIATSIGVGGSTVHRTKRRFVLGYLAAAPWAYLSPRSSTSDRRGPLATPQLTRSMSRSQAPSTMRSTRREDDRNGFKGRRNPITVVDQSRQITCCRWLASKT
jgi:hypothetical protein